MLAPVSYTPLTDEEVFAHYQTVAGESGLPICVYNNPSTTHFTFSPSLIQRLAAIPGIVAVKNPAPAKADVAARLADLRARVPTGVSLGYSVDAACAEAMVAGGDVWHSVLAGLCPELPLDICRAALAGNAALARRVNGRLQPIWDLFTRHGGLRVVYAAATFMGLSSARPPRPILPLDPVETSKVEEAFKAAGLI